MSKREYDELLTNEIATLWLRLNPNGEVHGCWIDDVRNVHLYMWYRHTDSSNGKNEIAPIEICIGHDPHEVVRTLLLAITLRREDK